MSLNPLESFTVFFGTDNTFSASQVPSSVRKNLQTLFFNLNDCITYVYLF